MFKNRFIVVLGALSLLLVAHAISRPFMSAPAPAELRWPPRPLVIPVTDANHLSDYYERHPKWASNDQDAVVPVTGNSELSDYYQRHPELKLSGSVIIDTSDYFIRHPELRPSANTVDLSDYFLRH